AHRRFYLSIARHVARIVALHVLDAVAIWAGVIIAGALTTPEVGLEMGRALIAVVLIGLNANGAYRAGAARRDVRRVLLGVLLAFAFLAALTVLPPPRIGVPLPF